jgi:hypothetical protein
MIHLMMIQIFDFNDLIIDLNREKVQNIKTLKYSQYFHFI